MTNGWTQSRKAKQRKAIYRWRPWEKSTGPKSAEGKSAVAKNALKHGARSREFLEQKRLARAFLGTAAQVTADLEF